MRIPCVDGHPERRGCGLENRKGASPRGFESLSLRQPAGQPAAERSSTSEAAWQAQVVRLAQRLGFYVYHPKLSRWSERGWPDLSLLGTRALWLECKRDDTHLSEKQVEVMQRMRACGLEVHVVRPWHGLEAVAELLQHGVAIA